MRYREIVCPKCKHRYMANLTDEYNIFIQECGIKRMGWEGKCTKCNEIFFVEDHVLEGNSFSNVPKGWIHMGIDVTER